MSDDDYGAICNLINRYFRLQDEGRFEDLAELFTDAVFHFPGRPPIVRDPARIAAIKRENVVFHGDPPSPCTRHAGQNVIVEFESAAAAHAWSSVLVFQAVPGFPLQPIIAASYHDRFEKIDGRWRFAERIMEVDLLGDLSCHLTQPIAPDARGQPPRRQI